MSMNNPLIQQLLTTSLRNRVAGRVSLSSFHQRMQERKAEQDRQSRVLATTQVAESRSPFSADSVQHARWTGEQLSRLLPKLPSSSVVQVVIHPMDSESRPILALTNVRYLETLMAAMLEPAPRQDSTSPVSQPSTSAE